MERSRTVCKNRDRSSALLFLVANIALTGLLSESRVVQSNVVLNATSLGQNTLEANRQTVNQLAVQGELKGRYFEKAHEAQDLQRHRRKLRPNRVTDVTRNRAFSDYGGQENAVIKVEDPYKVLEYINGQEEAFENSGEMTEGQRAKEEDAPWLAPWLAPQAKLTLNPVYDNYEEKKLQEMAEEHAREIAVNFYCQFPVPEVICIKSINTDITKDYIPGCTVVFRCRPRSGCCENGHICGVRNSSSIVRAFREISESSSGKIQLFRFTNHTECSCKPITDFQDDCLNCPESFEQRRRESGRCECYCDRESHNYKLCLSKTQGMRRLTESDLKCIQQNNCSKPPCAYGTFNLTTGFCPCNRHESLQRRKCEIRQSI